MKQVARDSSKVKIPHGQIKVVSFDVEGTLTTADFSRAIWEEGLPLLYARKHGIELDRAKEIVFAEYGKVGDQRLEWYDINYWFGYFGLGSYEALIQRYRDKIQYYPEVVDVLSSLAVRYKLIVASRVPELFLGTLLKGISSYFVNVFSSTSHYRQAKTPDFYRFLCRSMDVKPEEVVHVGDSWQFDFLSPRQVGIHAFHIDRSGQNHESLVDLTRLKPYLLGEV